mmetsp:Transcript_51318/g.109113  ORF Transcript_51318/g.109113 Transcript_51318/m.109113 type:complete len:286 (-) Transcript_51318:72-929(-)
MAFNSGFAQYLNNQQVPETATASLAGRELPRDLAKQVTRLTVGQLFYVLGHIQKLSAQAPVTAQALLAEHPQICYALLHAEYLAGMVEEPLLPMTGDELQQAKSKARRMREELEDHEIPQPEAAFDPAASSYGKAPSTSSRARPSPLGPASPGISAGVSGPAALPKSGMMMPTMGMGGMMPTQTQGLPIYHKAPGAAPFMGGMMGVPAAPTGHSQAGWGPYPPPPPPPPAPAAGLAAAMGGLGGGQASGEDLINRLRTLSPAAIARLPEHLQVQIVSILQQQQRR